VCTLVGFGALLLSVVLRSVNKDTGISTVGDRAAVVALAAGLSSTGSRWRYLFRPGQHPSGWAGVIPIAVVAGISVFRWSPQLPSAPALLLCTLVVAGLGLWAAGQKLDRIVDDPAVFQLAPLIAYGALWVTIGAIGAVNWRLWGTPGGLSVDLLGPNAGFLGLAAVWLIGMASLALGQRAPRYATALGFLAAALLVGIGLNVQWALPFN
jgi:hypothetical protein